jgi:phenylacetate-CoA ligase
MRKSQHEDGSLSQILEKLALGSQELEQLQIAKLKKLLLHVYENSPYYREKFDQADVHPHKFNSLEQIKDYPTFDKYEEQISQARSREELGHPMGMHITCDIRDVNRISASSGTSGTPSFQGHTANDRQIIFKNLHRLMDVIGGKPGDRVMMAGVMSMWVAGIPTVDALLEFGANVIPVGGLVGAAKVVELMTLTQPESLICTPSFALHILKRSKADLGVDLTKIGIRKVCVYGEPGGSIPEIIKRLSDGFGGAEIYDMAGGTGCLNPIFVSCKAHDGLHFISPDYAFIELYDRTTGKVLPFEDGAEGEFIYTGFDRECGPLIRFMDGDKVRVHLKPCRCGLPGMRMEFLGRVDDMLLVKGVNVFPSAIRDLVLSLGSEVTGNIQILKDSDSPVVQPPLKIKVECTGNPPDEAYTSIKQKLENKIRNQLRFSSEITLFAEGTLAMEYGATGKVKLLETVGKQ